MKLIDVNVINGTFSLNDQYSGREVMALLNQQPKIIEVIVSADGILKNLSDEDRKMFWRLADKANN